MEYPRPQLRRAAWRSLDGTWQAMFDDSTLYVDPAEVPFDRTIHTTGGGAATLATVLRRDWPKGLRFKTLNEATTGGAWRLAEMAAEA